MVLLFAFLVRPSHLVFVRRASVVFELKHPFHVNYGVPLSVHANHSPREEISDIKRVPPRDLLAIAFLLDYLRKKKPASLRLCALTDKPSRRQTPVNIDYLGFTVPDKFIVGYGIDCDEKYRNLPDICTLD